MLAAPNGCWQMGGGPAIAEYCCSAYQHPEAVAECFNRVFTFDVCCRGKASPFVQWPLSFIILGFPGCGTTSMIRALEAHKSVSVLRRDRYGRPWNGTEMQALGKLIEAGNRSSILGFGLSLARGQRTSRKRLMSDPTAVFDAGKTWALLQVRQAKFLVMLRDPVSWLVSQTCKQPCGEDHYRWNLCHRLPNWASGPAGEHTLRAPLAEWVRVCLTMSTWDLCTGLSMASPYFSSAVQRLVAMLPHRDQLAMLSLEGLSAEPAATMRAVHNFLQLDLPRQFDSSTSPAAYNVNVAGATCRQGMHKSVDSRINMFFRRERRYLASALKAFAPGSLQLPAGWRRFLRPFPNMTADVAEKLARQPLKPVVVSTASKDLSQ
ncbi:unnamed protein product [Symbiodinium sp. CCMP2456]|nr:unnamed protein product [Symbiodinium sp. CCMP2456]